MKELVNHPFYAMLSAEYPELLLDYVLLSDENAYCGRKSHKQAVLAAFSVLNQRERVGNRIQPKPFTVDAEKMRCKPCTLSDILRMHSIGWNNLDNRVRYHSIPEKLSYWYAFSEPPYGIPYHKADFDRINEMLFPQSHRKTMTAYRWNDDFSNYFDDGKEWWGTALWSIHDTVTNSFIIIGASLTD